MTANKPKPEPDAPAGADAPAPEDERARLQADLARSEDALLRLQAELQNQQRRHARDREQAERFRVEPLARELLDVMDALDEAVSAAADDAAFPAAAREGQELIRRRLADILARFSIAALDPAGEAFDPQEHEAVAAQPDADAQPGTVLAVLRKGYRLHDRLLRPARVAVAAEIPEESKEDGSSGAAS